MPAEQGERCTSSVAMLTATTTTTLHLTLLTSHYLGFTEADEVASASGASGGHRKEAANAKAVAAAPKATGKEKDTYTCRTSAEQLDSVARVLRSVLHQRCHPSTSSTSQQSADRERDIIASHAHHVQLVKAVRDGAVSWAGITSLLEDPETGMHAAKDTSVPCFGAQPKLSTFLPNDLTGIPATIAAANTNTATAASAAAKSAPRASSRGRGGGSNAAVGSGAHRRRTSSGSSHRSSSMALSQQYLAEAESRYQAFFNSQLPPCEVATVTVSAAAPGDSRSPTLSSQSYPVFFLYHLVNEDEVLAALAALNSAEADEAGSEAGSALPERERRRARASQVTALVTRAVWCTLRPALRCYLHSAGATAVPSHLSVVWAVSEPSLLEGLNSYTGKSADDVISFIPCPSRVPASGGPTSDTVEDAGAASVERWVRLVPLSAIYLYDPVMLSGPGSAPVEAALAALQIDRADKPRGLADADLTKAGRRWGSAEGGAKAAPPSQRGGQGTTTTAAASTAHKANRATGGTTASSTTTKGRSGNARGDGASASNGATVAKGPLSNAPTDQKDAAALVDMNAEPSTFPYCATDSASLACYLYPGCEIVTDGAAHTASTREQRGKAMTTFLSRAAAYQRAVFASITANTPVRVEAKSSLRVTAETLKWVQAFLSSTATKEEERGGDVQCSALLESEAKSLLSTMTMQTGVAASGCSVDLATLLGEVSKTSLMRTGLDSNRWPLPLWTITAVPFAAVPPLPLRPAGSGSNVGGAENAAKDAPASQLGLDALAILANWASTLKGLGSGASDVRVQQSSGMEVLLRQVTRLGRLADAYATWTLRIAPHLADHRNRLPCRDTGKEKKNSGAGEAVRFTHDSYAGGVFTLANAISALMAETSRSLARQTVPQSLTAVCAAREDDSGTQGPTPPSSPTQVVATHAPSSLFHKYKEPFQRLAAAHDGGCAAEAATVPRTAPTSPGDAVTERCVVKAVDTKESADVVLPPYRQEVVSMVRHIVAKNAGHFEVNTARGTDTISTALTNGGSSGGATSALVDSTMTRSTFSPAACPAATLNTTTQSTGLLLRHQQQQQRRRQRGHGGSVGAALLPYVHGVRLVREVSQAYLGRRPNTEAAVLWQEALESTLATPPDWKPVDHSLRCFGDVREKAEKSYLVKVSALELLQRYLTNGRASPHTQGELSAAARRIVSSNRSLAKASDSALSAANAASAAAQALSPRVYEHCLQQVLLNQLLREAGLGPRAPPSPLHSGLVRNDGDENDSEDWTVTEQIPTENIVSSLVDFRERFGAHNVTVKASALDYHFCPTMATTVPSSHSSTPPTGKAAVSTTARNGATKIADEVHQTSAYAHNAINVHPTRRATQLWMAGVSLPSGAGAEGADFTGCHDSKKGKEESLSSLLRRCRTRKWVDMVPRAGAITSMEVYTLWHSLLHTELGKTAVHATPTESASDATEPGRSSLVLTSKIAYQLIHQYMQRHAETSTALLNSVESSPSAPSEAAAVTTLPMSFTTHETLYPYGDALLEVWCGETQRMCRYIKASEVTAALHMGVRSPEMLSSPLHLSVRWDDGLLLTCSTSGAQKSSSVPLIDVQVTTSNVVLQRCAEEGRLQLRRFPNTSSRATAADIAARQESGGQPVASPPQGLLSEVCSLLFEERTTLCCVHDCPPLENQCAAAASQESPTALMEATIETSVEEAEVSSEVDERTGVVHRTYPSGSQLLQFPSGAMLIRRPIAAENVTAGMAAAKPAAASSLSPSQPVAQQWCETLITCDGRCFVRRLRTQAKEPAPVAQEDTTAEPASPSSAATAAPTAATSVFRRVTPRMKKDGLSPAFTHAETIYDAVRHCHIRSRQDGLIVVEYGSLMDTSVAAMATTMQQAGATIMARVVVFPDGTSITTLAHRDVRQRLLSTRGAAVGDSSLPAAVALSSPSLCAMLEEVNAVENGLFGPSAAVEAEVECAGKAAADARSSVRWLVEAPTFPRFYLAPAEAEHKAAFSVVFGDGTILQRHWQPAATSISPSGDVTRLQSSNDSSDSTTLSAACRAGHQPREGNDAAADDDLFNQGAPASSSSAVASTSYSGGTVATVLVRPSTSVVRVLHQHAIATVEPADVLASTTRASPAAYAVGQGLPFFDLSYGGGIRLVDAARYVWEIRALASFSGPKVFYPDHPWTYEELLRELVSTYYSPHRLPRAAELAYAAEQRQERALYARQRSTGWCPPLVRRLRELSEPYIRTANLLRTDILAPIEAAAAGALERTKLALTGASMQRASTAHRAAAARDVVSIRPVCFGQLANGESVRYWCAKDVICAPSSSEASAASVAAVANEPHVLQCIVPSASTGSVLRYTGSAPMYASATGVMAVLSAVGGRSDAGCIGSALDQRLAEAERLSLLCIGGLAPALPPPSVNRSSQQFGAAYASNLPPLAVLISHGCRWLPPSLQPPQQFSPTYSKSAVHAVAAQSDIVWAQNATASAAASTAGAAYLQYMTKHMDPGVPPAMLRAAVVRRELHRYEELAQLSHYHRVLTSQWPMEQPDAAREEQVRLEMRCEELLRARRPLLGEEKLCSPHAASKDPNWVERKQQPTSRLVI
ncbi:hypothetical protein ABL78_7753 [Leptomonas seymouri]|uniref:Uncharacterized protein n=1 Tax=Leptomonas seymouri TaxID=5684 RepID=A0A0N1PA42_LEPSE|nr:hypothetical protein ABL78_7753 [Leptomonas seymouri]|eukprot:KPI83225.1 hypothetical protein ABL78_7753 [Leptomonas seymouri]